MIVSTPPMGWNSWNTFGQNIDEKMIMETAEKMVSEGLLDCGYKYLVIDDCWSKRVRDENGKLEPDPEKFPHGIKYVSDFIHSKGLKFGMYSCAGTVTCAFYPGSFEHEYDDAESFASWGVDFLKYDYCFRDGNVPGEVLYRRMGLALANCGRDILFSACNWGADNSETWIKTTGAHMWRSTGDIVDTWQSIADLTKAQLRLFPYAARGCFNDMDMLVVGMGGKGNVARPDSRLTYDEYKTHFSIWALLNSPLMIGCDIRNMSEETKKILMNRDVIALNQDAAVIQPFMNKRLGNDTPIICRYLEGGDIAIGIFNLSDHPANIWQCNITLSEIGIPRSSHKTLHMRELWTNEEYDVENEIIGLPRKLNAHDCFLYRASLIPSRY